MDRDFQAEIAAMNPQTPEEFRERAGLHAQEQQASYERCDTDGALSQWAHGVMSQKDSLEACIRENGGMADFAALFDLDGNMVPAKLIETRYGWSWMLLDSNGKRTGEFFNESKAKKDETRIANNAKKGFYVGRVNHPAYADLAGGNICTVMAYAKPRGGWVDPAKAVILDNGKS